MKIANYYDQPDAKVELPPYHVFNIADSLYGRTKSWKVPKKTITAVSKVFLPHSVLIDRAMICVGMSLLYAVMEQKELLRAKNRYISTHSSFDISLSYLWKKYTQMLGGEVFRPVNLSMKIIAFQLGELGLQRVSRN